MGHPVVYIQTYTANQAYIYIVYIYLNLNFNNNYEFLKYWVQIMQKYSIIILLLILFSSSMFTFLLLLTHLKKFWKNDFFSKLEEMLTFLSWEVRVWIVELMFRQFFRKFTFAWANLFANYCEFFVHFFSFKGIVNTVSSEPPCNDLRR